MAATLPTSSNSQPPWKRKTAPYIPVPANDYAVQPIAVQVQEEHSLFPGMEVFSFREQELRMKLMAQAKKHLEKFKIQNGLWPTRYAGYGADNYHKYYELIWNEGGGHGLELILANIPLPENPERKMLDFRIKVGGCSLNTELILQKDSGLPPWRSQTANYQIESVYFSKSGQRVYLVSLKADISGRVIGAASSIRQL